ncbi:MAG: hypothetical protein HQM03_02990 [Magnetococcales bacterium]|nr:hypothetical protein [Magnetococcales bacterium]
MHFEILVEGQCDKTGAGHQAVFADQAKTRSGSVASKTAMGQRNHPAYGCGTQHIAEFLLFSGWDHPRVAPKPL